MLRPRIIPCILLKNRGLVKTTRFDKPVYIGDPINAVRIFNDKEVDELIFLDIAASMDKKTPNLEIIKDIASECFMPFGFGGGIRSIHVAEKILSAGAEKIIVNSFAVENPAFVRELSSHLGSQSVVISIDVRKKILKGYEVYSYSGTRASGINPVDYAKKMEDLGAGEILINNIDRDGTMEGYDLELTRRIADSVSIPAVTCGGAGSLMHLKEGIIEGHASAAAAGSLFVFFGPRKGVLINYPSQEEIRNNILSY